MTETNRSAEEKQGPTGSSFRQELRQFGSQGVIYAVGTMLMRLIGFVLVPVYTKHLPEESYGIYGILILVTQVVMTFLGLGLMNALFRHWAGAKDADAKRRLISTTVWSQTFMLFAGLGVFLLNPAWWSRILLGSSQWGDFILLAIGAGLLDMFLATPLGVVRMEERPGFYTTVMVVRTLISTVLAIYLVAWRDAGVMGVLEANLIGVLSACVMVLPLVVRRCGWVVDIPLLKEMLPFGLWYVVGSTASLFLSMGDRYVLNYLVGLSAVGVYTLGHQLATTINVLGQSFLSAYLPMGLKRDVSVDGGRFVTKTLTYFALGLAWVGLGFSLFAPEIVHLLARNPGYYPALKVVPLLVLAAVLYVLAMGVDISFFFAGRARYVTWSIVISAALNVGLNFTFIPLFGLVGASLAAAIASAGRFALSYHWAQRVYPLPYDVRRILLVLAVAIAAHAVMLVPGAWWAIAGLKLLVTLAFPLVLWYAGFFTPFEQQELRTGFLRALSYVGVRGETHVR